MAETFEIHTIELDTPEARDNPWVKKYFALRHDEFQRHYKTTKYVKEGTEADYASGNRAYVATVGGKVVACLGSSMRGPEGPALHLEKLVDLKTVLPHIAWENHRMAEAKAMVRLPEYKGQHLYEALFDAMHAEVKKQGADLVAWTTSPQSNRGGSSFLRNHSEPRDQFFLADPPLLHPPASGVRLMLMVEGLNPEKGTVRTPEMIRKAIGAPPTRARLDQMLGAPRLLDIPQR